MRARGFTLIEVLMALAILGLIVGISYAALTPAGEGFRIIAGERDRQAIQAWLSRQLERDLAGMTQSHVADARPLRVTNDSRGGLDFDTLTITRREPGRPGVYLVKYWLDEQEGHLKRTSRMLWARDPTKVEEWDMGPAEAFGVELLDAGGRWRQRWSGQGVFVWPRAIRISVVRDGKRREMLFPVLHGRLK